MTERDGEQRPRRAPDRVASLVCHVATRISALPLGVVPLGVVIETPRPLPVEPIVERAAS